MKNTLKNTRLFHEMDDNSLTEICKSAVRRSIGKGEAIIYEHDPAVAFFVVVSGKVKVYKLSSDGKEQILLLAGEGDSFAEAAMFSGGQYPASAQALVDTELIVLNRDRFLNLLRQNPDLALNMLARMSQLLHKLTDLVESLSLDDVTTRLAHFLIDRIDDKTEGGSPVLELDEKKSVLAALLGTIPETLSRSLAKLSKDKIISVNGSQIKILDTDRLHRLTQ